MVFLFVAKAKRATKKAAKPAARSPRVSAKALDETLLAVQKENSSRRTSMALMVLAYANTLLVSLFLGAAFIASGISVTDNPAEVANSVAIFAVTLVTAVVMIFLLRFYKGKLLFQLLELGLVFSAFSILSSVATPDYAPLVALAVIVLRLLVPSLRQLTLFASAAIVGALLGASLDIIPAIAFVFLLSIYDFVAVFKTKHMIELAKSLTQREAAMSVTSKVGGSGVELGLGDFVVGSMLAVSALKIGGAYHFGYGLAAVLGASAGLAAMFLYLERKRGFFPAVPPIFAGSLLCMVAYWAIKAFVFGAA